MLQASTYGLPIPIIYGLTQSPALVIWAQNLRNGSSSKKFKQLKKNTIGYVENIDFLIGKNPILYTAQWWNNNAKYPLAIQTQTFTPARAGSVLVTDPYFYAVIGVTVSGAYNQTFDDYGGFGSNTQTGSWEVPLWNQAILGPNPTDNNAPLFYPYTYVWTPAMGTLVSIPGCSDTVAYVFNTVTVYYYQLTSATSYQPPISRLRLTFENELGNGPEYSGYSSEQIIYPEYAGAGSPDIDLGSAGTIPSLYPETMGKFAVYPSGDCDFVDIFRDIVNSGISQSGIDGTGGTNITQHGVSCYDYPGVIQKYYAGLFESHKNSIVFGIPTTAGNQIIVFVAADSPSAPTVSDSDGNSYTLIGDGVLTTGPLGTYYWSCYVATNINGGVDTTITWANPGFYGTTAVIMELAGVDTLTSYVAVSDSAPSISLTTTNTPGTTAVLIAVACIRSPNTPTQTQLWPLVLPNVSGVGWGETYVQQRNVTTPGTYTLATEAGGGGPLIGLCFQQSQPQTYANPLPNFLDDTTMQLTRLQCRANGLWGALAMTSQKAASDWCNDLIDAMNCYPVFSGFSLKLWPRSEVSLCGNGAIYSAPTAAGPVANLSDLVGDFIDPPVAVPKARTDLDTVLQMQHINRASDYAQVVTAVPDTASILKYGVRKAEAVMNNAIQSTGIAQTILQIMVRRKNYIENIEWTFTLNAKHGLLEPPDLVTITDSLQGINSLPVRITSIVEDDKFNLKCKAEPFKYGIHAPQPFAGATNAQFRGGNTQFTPAGINGPIIFEPPLRMTAGVPQIWAIMSSPNSNYGGTQVDVSPDNGVSYINASEPVLGSAVQGFTLQFEDWPAAADPDTTNNLQVDLSESNGTLANYSAAERDNFLTPCYVGYNPTASSLAQYTSGDPAQITSLGVLFSNSTVPTLPPGSTISDIYPIIAVNAYPSGTSAVTQGFYGSSMTPTSGGTSFLPPGTVYAYGPSIGSSLSALTGAEIRFAFNYSVTGPAATGVVQAVGWAILYTGPNTWQDSTLPLPFDQGTPGIGWACALPQTVANGQVGTGTNASITSWSSTPPNAIGYELITYNSATMTAANMYTINATGSGNQIRRGVYAIPSVGMGMDHSPFSPFAVISPPKTGIFMINLDPAWIGTQLIFKFLSFNNTGTPPGSLLYDYYTPTGIPSSIGPSSGFLINGM